jgi:glutamate/tyrosine decarboxylase-like PLP-dependent enzyme
VGEWPDREVHDALLALERTDSVTIDPHKLGFVPYPAGAVSFRDRRARHLVAVDAPYVFHGDEDEWGNIGRYILEGSKPGAAAAGVWMSHKVLPLDVDGYGRLIRATASAARLLHDRLGAHDWAPFRIVRLPAPDINLVCFAFGHPTLATLEDTNALTGRVHHAMSVGGRTREVPDYYVSMTTLRPSEYGAAALPVVEALGFTEEDYPRAGGVSVIRCTVMDPFLASTRGPADHIAGLIGTLSSVLEEHLEPANG